MTTLRPVAVPSGQAAAASLAGLLLVLGALAPTVGLGLSAVAVGVVCGGVLGVALPRGLARAGSHSLGPGDLVTLTRATLACALAALVADALLRAPAHTTLVTLTVVTLALDAVDGPVARRTGTVSPFGARFDGEADAFLMLVLSVYLAPLAGPWVLAIGAARYLFGAAGWVWPWMRGQLPFRYWRKVVTAVQGIVLGAAVAEVLPPLLRDVALVAALALLAESFGRDVVWLWRRRHGSPARRSAAAQAARVP